MPGAAGIHWLPRFGDGVQTAVVQFAMRTLARSGQHRLIVAFYLGIGFAAAIFFLKLPRPEASAMSVANPWLDSSVPMLLSSLLMMLFAVLGARVACSLPRDLGANWIFRLTPIEAGARCLASRRRAMFVELSVLSAQKIPFTCAWLPGKSTIHSDGTSPQFDEERPGRMASLDLWDMRFR